MRPKPTERGAAANRVAVLLPETAVGGVERVMTALAAGLAEAGYAVDLVVATGSGRLAGVPESVRVVPLGARRTARATRPLARYLRNEPVAALVTAKDYATLVALAARWLARRPGGRHGRDRIPVIATVHAPPSEAWATTRRSGRALRPLLRAFLGRADRIVAVSDGVAADVRALLGDHGRSVDVVSSPVIDPALFADAAGPPPHPWLLTDRTAPVLVSCGRLSTEKDPQTTVAAFAIARRARPLRLLVLGDGPERHAVESQVTRLGLTDDVRMLGHVSPVAPYLARADICVLSSRTEGMPTVAIEALALGTPVVATATAAGVRELIGDGRGGRLAPVGDAGALAVAVVAELDTPSPPLDAAALEPFTVAAATAKYAAILRSVGVAGSPTVRTTTALCILCRDRPAALADALASAKGFDQIIVVDMASEPPLESTTQPGLSWHREPTNLGVTRGRNLLVELASADIVVFLDDDAAMVSGDATTIADEFARRPDLGVLAFLVRRADGRVESSEWPFRGKPHDIDRPRPAAYFLGGACAVRRDAFLAAGGYDESFFYSTEEIDLAFTLAGLGFTIEYTPDVVVEHRPAAAGRVANPAVPGLRLRNRIVLARRHLPRPIAAVHIAAWGLRTAREARSAHGWAQWKTAWRDGRSVAVVRRPLPYGTLGRLHRDGGRVLW
jgi:glycosyltransferase involved in cell wall biosynthesis/GT2 family glycosyltransferase